MEDTALVPSGPTPKLVVLRYVPSGVVETLNVDPAAGKFTVADVRKHATEQWGPADSTVVRDGDTDAELQGAIPLGKGGDVKLHVHRVYPAHRQAKGVHVRVLVGDSWCTDTMFSQAARSVAMFITPLTTAHVLLMALHYAGCALDVYSSRVTDLGTGRHLGGHEDVFATTSSEGCLLVDDQPGTQLVTALVVMRMSRGRGFAMERLFSLAQPCAKVLALLLQTLGGKIEQSLGVVASQDTVDITLDDVPLPFTGAEAALPFGDLPVVRKLLAACNHGQGPTRNHVVPLKTPIVLRAARSAPPAACIDAVTTPSSLLADATAVVASLPPLSDCEYVG